MGIEFLFLIDFIILFFQPHRWNYFENNIISVVYTFMATIKVNIFDGLYIDFTEIEKAAET